MSSQGFKVSKQKAQQNTQRDLGPTKPLNYSPFVFYNIIRMVSDGNNVGGKDITESKLFNDPIHHSISMPALCVAIIDTPEFQRLRYIKQVGMSFYVYPGGNHSRFEHSIGVSHLAGAFVKMLKDNQPELKINQRDVLCAQVAGLCHDLGHGPFSHTWERFLEKKNVKCRTTGIKWRHEDMSVKLFDFVCQKHNLEKCLEKNFGENFRQYVEIIKQQINGSDETRLKQKWQVGDEEDKSFLYEIVANDSSHVDVDKWDYLLRDGHHMGFPENFDYERLASLAGVYDCTDNRKHICYSRKATPLILNMFKIRLDMHRHAYRHKVVQMMDYMLLDALCLADSSITVKGNNGEYLCMSEAASDLVAFTKLTDYVFQMIIHAKPGVEGSKIAKDLLDAQEILSRIEYRKLYGVTDDYIPIDARLHKKVEEHHDAIRGDIFSRLNRNDVQATKRKHNTLLVEEDIYLKVARFDYGDKNNNPGNPLDKVWIYEKYEPKRGVRVKPEDVSKMLPNEYEESMLLCICRKKEFTQVVRPAFHEWLKQVVADGDSR